MRCVVGAVISADVRIFKSNPPQLYVVARGKTNSSGWTDAVLLPWIQLTQPTDGIADFTLTADSPQGPSIPGAPEVTAAATFVVPPWVTGARVHAAANTIGPMTQIAASEAEVKGGDSVPWPWSATETK